MSRASADASMNIQQPVRPADKAVEDGPTIFNGPLADKPGTVEERLITAEFAAIDQATAARDRLVQAGVAPGSIQIAAAADSPDHRAHARPADDTLIGRLREAVLPDEVSAASRHAIAAGVVVLTVRPAAAQVDHVVQVLQASQPSRFDADLERWRNNG